MKIVIDIPDNIMEYLRNNGCLSVIYTDEVAKAIINGTPYDDRPIGYWKDHRWCSNCGCGIPTDVYGTSITEEEAHFCVECGARMEVEE